jgi:hypothetical protein
LDHPSFFHPFGLTRVFAGFLPDGGPSSLSLSADNVFALVGEFYFSLTAGTPQNNTFALSSTVDKSGNSSHTNGNKSRPKTKNDLRPCKQSEAML